MSYNGKKYGDPMIGIRLPPNILAAVKICARQHGTTISGLIRELIDEQLTKDGIPTTSEPLPGQLSM